MTIIHRLRKHALVAAAAAAAGLNGCAVAPPSRAVLNIDPVGPPVPVRLIPRSVGTLVVYSDWVPATPMDIDFHQHVDYRILRVDGTLYRKVYNGGIPAPVPLPAGTYLVDTSVSPYGRVRIPVKIAEDLTTTVCLTGEFDGQFKRVPDEALVKLPDGRVIGWRSP